MKKLLALILAIMMIATLSVTAFAVEDRVDPTTGGNDHLYYDPDNNVTNGDGDEVDNTGDVVVSVENTNVPAEVYYVVITWKELKFTFTFNTGVQWDPETHQYGVLTDGTWNYTLAAVGSWDKTYIETAIQVDNHSNATVNVEAAYVANAAMNNSGVTATLTNEMVDKIELVSAEGKASNAADKVTYKLAITDTVPNANNEFVLGTITVTVSHS